MTDNTELARRAVACKGWRWMPGDPAKLRQAAYEGMCLAVIGVAFMYLTWPAWLVGIYLAHHTTIHSNVSIVWK